MKQKDKIFPADYHTISPYLIVKNAVNAIDFYRQAFGMEYCDA
jgi:hypothetical protein